MRGGYCVVAIVVGLVGATVARGASVVAGPVVNPANQHTYYLLTADTWTNSQAFAQTLGGNLATIDDAAENTWVFQQFGTGRDLWIGVWSQNFGAQRFYARYGFGKVGDYEFPVGRVRDHEFILRRGAPTPP